MRKPAAILSAILVGSVVWFFIQSFQVVGTDSVEVVPKEDGLMSAVVQRVLRATSQKSDTDEPEGNQNADAGAPIGGTDETPLSASNSGNIRASNPSSEIAGQIETTATKPVEYAPRQLPNTIRIASFHLHYFGSAADRPDLTMNAVARVVRLFDVLALQGVSPSGEASLAKLVAKAGKKYDYLVGTARVGAPSDQLLAFVYNRDTIVADRAEGLYTIGDPDNLIRRDPLIGWFRAKQAPAESAFTFTLVNVHTDRRHVLQELDVLDDAFHEVRQDWRDEDDVIMLGCFQRSDSQLSELSHVRHLNPVIRGTATTVRGDRQTENILFRRSETDEFTGHGGVFNFLRAYNLSLNQALQVSDFLPVWAEFSIYEKGARIAGLEKKD